MHEGAFKFGEQKYLEYGTIDSPYDKVWRVIPVAIYVSFMNEQDQHIADESLSNLMNKLEIEK